MSDRAADQVFQTFTTPFKAVAQSLRGCQDVAYAAHAFRRKNNRWPQDFSELSTFVEQSNGFLILGEYDRVDLTNLPNDELEITCVVSGRFAHLTLAAPN